MTTNSRWQFLISEGGILVNIFVRLQWKAGKKSLRISHVEASLYGLPYPLAPNPLVTYFALLLRIMPRRIKAKNLLSTILHEPAFATP